MNKILPRAVENRFARSLMVQPVVAVMGARQVGKSTLVRSMPALSEYRYVTLDDLQILAMASTSPADLLDRGDRLILDEVQRDPDLLIEIKRRVDEAPRRPRGRFVLTGSANLLLMRGVSETLGGRASYVRLWPLSRQERLGRGRCGLWEELLGSPIRSWRDLVAGQNLPPAVWRDEALRGGYPTPSLELDDAEDRTIWFRGYVQTYLERDLQDLSAISDLVDFRRFMRAACLRIGGLANQTEIARDVGVSQPTIHRWLNLLETSFQLVRIEPYSANRTTRIVRRPKVYWSDTGLALHLSSDEPRGAHLENIVLTDLLCWRDGRMVDSEILTWRTPDGREVDFVVETSEGILGVEVKSTSRPGTGDAAGLRELRDQDPSRWLGGLLLHDGESVDWIGDRILAAPWWSVL